jgi:peptidoglycan/LPS O-acetylase OafA/YrhL
MALAEAQRGRIVELDGLRGLAILLVVGFHYFGRFTAERGVRLYPMATVLPPGRSPAMAGSASSCSSSFPAS